MANFAAVEPFTDITSNQVVHLINQIATGFDQLARSPVLGVPLPFVQGFTVGAAMDPGSAIRTTLFSHLTTVVVDPDTGISTYVPTFATAQELVAQLAAILQVPPSNIDPQYDPTTGGLTFTVRFTVTNPSATLPFSVDRGDLGLELQTTAATVTADASTTLAFTFGTTLVHSGAPLLSGEQTVQANGVLSADAHFTLSTDAGAPVLVTVSASSTVDNHTPLDLVADVNAALAAAGVGSVVAGLNTPNPMLTGTIPAPSSGRLLGASKFTLTIDDHPPIAVSIPQSATQGNTTPQELVDDFNTALEAALAAAGLPTNLVAVRGELGAGPRGGAANPRERATGERCPVHADDPLHGHDTGKHGRGDGPPAATQNNTTPQDLVADFNNALQAAGLSGTIGEQSFGAFGQQVDGTLPIPTTGQLGAAANFTVSIDGASPVAVVVPLSATEDNTSPQDLVGDFNTALEAAGLGAIVAGLDGQFLVFNASLGAGINTVTLSAKGETRWSRSSVSRPISRASRRHGC